jgi:hypothetical protein
MKIRIKGKYFCGWNMNLVWLMEEVDLEIDYNHYGTKSSWRIERKRSCMKKKEQWKRMCEGFGTHGNFLLFIYALFSTFWNASSLL